MKSIKKLAAFSALILLASNPAVAANRTLTVTAVTHQAETRQYTSSYTVPGSPGNSNTNCSGTGTASGPTTTDIDMNCQGTATAPTPPQTQNITTSRGYVTDVVEGNDGFIYTIQCTANWAGSNCGPLTDGDTFQAEIDGTTMWLQGSKGGNQGKLVKVKYKITDIRPVPRPAVPAVEPSPEEPVIQLLSVPMGQAFPEWETKTYRSTPNGNELYADCQEWKRNMIVSPDLMTINPNPDNLGGVFQAGRCYSYIRAVIDSIPIGEDIAHDPRISLSQVLEAVLAYLQAHPELRHLPAYVLTRIALTEAFPEHTGSK